VSLNLNAVKSNEHVLATVAVWDARCLEMHGFILGETYLLKSIEKALDQEAHE